MSHSSFLKSIHHLLPSHPSVVHTRERREEGEKKRRESHTGERTTWGGGHTVWWRQCVPFTEHWLNSSATTEAFLWICLSIATQWPHWGGACGAADVLLGIEKRDDGVQMVLMQLMDAKEKKGWVKGKEETSIASFFFFLRKFVWQQKYFLFSVWWSVSQHTTHPNQQKSDRDTCHKIHYEKQLEHDNERTVRRENKEMLVPLLPFLHPSLEPNTVNMKEGNTLRNDSRNLLSLFYPLVWKNHAESVSTVFRLRTPPPFFLLFIRFSSFVGSTSHTENSNAMCYNEWTFSHGAIKIYFTKNARTNEIELPRPKHDCALSSLFNISCTHSFPPLSHTHHYYHLDIFLFI